MPFAFRANGGRRTRAGGTSRESNLVRRDGALKFQWPPYRNRATPGSGRTGRVPERTVADPALWQHDCGAGSRAPATLGIAGTDQRPATA